MNFRSKFWPTAIAFASILTGCATAPLNPEIGSIEKSPDRPAVAVASGDQTNDFADPDGYSLGQGDTISIQVFDEPDLTLDARVSSNGIINYSYLGDIQVSGKTPLELEQHISGRLKDGFLVNPSVNVTVTEYRPFFIGGEVRAPGSYPFQPGLTLDKAIALAGGLTDRASTRRMFVIQAGGSSTESQKISLGAPVAPGDTISIREGFF